MLAITFVTWPVAAATDYEKHAEGLAVYMGVLPAQVLRGKPGTDHLTTMHGGLPRGNGSHHVVVSIFDERTRRQLADVTVEASVGSPGLGGTHRSLEPMRIGETTTFGNFFPMSGAGPFIVRVTIRRPGQNPPIQLQFNYTHPK
jgi:hypothetical protein